jgi:hypothetical protein
METKKSSAAGAQHKGKHMKKTSYPKGQPSGARGKPEKAKGDGVGARKDREQSMKGQPRGVDSHNPAKKGHLAKPFKRSDR